jgi:PAS domain S-box-containing protein
MSAVVQPLKEVLFAERGSAAELREAVDTLPHILALLPVGVYACDAEGRITFFNQKAAELWGRAPLLHDNEEKYCPCARVVLPDGRTLPRDQTPMARALREGKSFRNVEAEVERPDGTRFTASVNIDPIFGSNGEVTGAINVFHDITSTNSAKLALERELRERERSSYHASFLSRLSQRLAVVSDAGAIVRTACEEVAAHLGTERCFFTESDRSGDTVSIGEEWARPGLPKIGGSYRSADFAAAALLEAPAPTPLLVADVAEHPFTRDHADKFAQLGIRAFALAPFVRGDGGVSNLMVTVGEARLWREDEQGLLENVVARVRPLIDQARAAQTVRENAERLRLAMEASEMGDWSWQRDSDEVTLSASAARLFGLPAAGKTTWARLRELIHEADRERTHLAVMQAIDSRKEYRADYRIRTARGEIHWLSARGRVLLTDHGEVAGLLGVVMDITERRLDEDARRRLAAIVESSNDAIVSKTLDGTVTSWNHGAELIFGYTADEMIGQPVTLIIPPERLNEETQIIAGIGKGERLEPFETIRMRKDGSRVHVSVTISPLRDRDGNIVGASKIARDITDRKLAEAEVRASESRWRELAEAMPHLVWISASDGNCEFISPQWCAYTGSSEEEQRGMGWAEAIHPEDRKAFELAWNLCAHSRNILDMELRIRRSDGVYRWFKTRVVPVADAAGNIVKWYGSNTDIEDIRRTDQALRENESRLSALFAQAGSGIIQTDLEGRIVMVNDAYCEIVARKREEVLGMHIHDLTHPDDRPLHRQPFDDMMRGGPAFVIEKRDVRPDGTPVWVRNSVVGIRDSEGRVAAGLTIAQDITDSREVENAMRASEEQLRLVTDHAPVLLAQFDRQHRYKFVNQPYAARYGYEPAAVIGKHASEVLGSDVYASMKVNMEQASQGHRVEFELEMPKEGEDGQWWSVIFVPERTAAGEVVGLLSVLSDITARKDEERELEQARDHALAAARAKDEFLARLSHELRTPLSPVLLLASEGAANDQLPPAARADFETIRKNVDLEARLIDDLLDLTRITRGKLSLEHNPLDLHAVLRDAVGVVRPDAQQKGLELELSLDADVAKVTGDAVRLQQVFWNLLNNAVKFTQAGGRIRVETRLAGAEGPLVIRVTDTGIGMTPEELQRVFNAFSQGDHASGGGSTRFGGLGLGLAISRMLVELHRGQIRAESEGRGMGSTFAIELPLRLTEGPERFSPGDAQPTGLLAPPASGRAAGAPLRILLVEDHEPTRTALTSLLSRRHHSVQPAESLAEARRALLAEKFDLLISDIGLPDGTGYELMGEVRERYRLPGIALSGYGMEQDVARSREVGFASHLTKPVRMQALDAAISEAAGECNLHAAVPAAGEKPEI